MQTLSIVSLMAANALPIYRSVARYLSRQTGLRVTLIEGLPWHEQEQLLDRGQAEIGIICGLLYTHKTAWLDLLAAPVMWAARYQGRPLYFSDIVVPHDSRFQAFADLRGARWLYNDRGSFSGYAVLRAHLAGLGESGDFCGHIRESGGHLRSLALIAAGAADATAIDSTVLELELMQRPELAGQIRVVAAIGPHPIPPVVVAKQISAALKQRLHAALLCMHEDVQGSEILADGLIERFVAVQDSDYDQVRLTTRRAEQVHFDYHCE